MQTKPEQYKKREPELLNIPTIETSVTDIKGLIEEWEKNADIYKIEPPGESRCLKSQGVK